MRKETETALESEGKHVQDPSINLLSTARDTRCSRVSLSESIPAGDETVSRSFPHLSRERKHEKTADRESVGLIQWRKSWIEIWFENKPS